MLVYRTVEEKVLRQFDSIIMQNMCHNLLLFCTQTWPSHHVIGMFLFRARAEKGIARHIDASSVVWTLTDNGKLANQIARLAAVLVKYSVPAVYFAVTIFHVLLLS